MMANIIINIIINLILFITLITLILFLISFFNYTTKNKLYLYKWKITNYTFTLSIILFYIIVFIFFFYYLRLINIGKFMDLKTLYINISEIWSIFITPLTSLTKFYLISYFIIMFLVLVTLFIYIMKFIMLQLFKFYIFKYKNPVVISKNILKRKHPLIDMTSLADNDILSYSISKLLGKLLTNMPDNLIKSYVIIIKNTLIYNKKYKLMFNLSPVMFFIYDCIFNNFIIIHLYYYLLIFTPLMIIKRATTAIFKTNEGFTDILWFLYYTKEKNVYYIANKEQKKIIDLLVMANITYIQEFLLDMVEYHLKLSITYTLYDINNNIYCNNDETFLKVENNKIFEIIENENGTLYKETHDWILL